MQNSTSNDKQIKKSRRGLTFSFPSAGRLSVGSHYDYVIEKASRSIRIVPAEAGRYKISRKKNGNTWSSLVDLRNKEILEAVAEMEQLYVHISDDQIVVSDGKVHTGAVSKKTSPIIVFQRADLARLRMAAGLDDILAAGRILEYTQISLDEYLAESQDPLSVSTVQRTLPISRQSSLCSAAQASWIGPLLRTRSSLFVTPLTMTLRPARHTGRISGCTLSMGTFTRHSLKQGILWMIRSLTQTSLSAARPVSRSRMPTAIPGWMTTRTATSSCSTCALSRP